MLAFRTVKATQAFLRLAYVVKGQEPEAAMPSDPGAAMEC